MFLDTPLLTCKFSSDNFFRWVLRISYTAGTIVLFKLGAVSASGEIGNSFFLLHVVACVIKVFCIFGGLVYCRELPASCNSFSLFL